MFLSLLKTGAVKEGSFPQSQGSFTEARLMNSARIKKNKTKIGGAGGFGEKINIEIEPKLVIVLDNYELTFKNIMLYDQDYSVLNLDGSLGGNNSIIL